ncbi:helix-turn-helix domain-containing protein [Bordetella ansorpii]|uniref:helix-turn-helix domain-containing protein n=1 Tax=Bordetella ansorpii TaxID=288768 RepID=UPI0012E807E0|nr:helix-turn-helix transcriptional regulator [Bordetella ansorpii]
MTRNKNKLETFGQRLRSARLGAGWTQKELAGESGLTQSAIGNYESEQRVEPTGAALVRLAQALRVTPEWLSQGRPPTDGIGVGSATNGPGLPRGPGQARWPFRQVSAEDYANLTSMEKRTLEALVAAFVRSCKEEKR